jgi:iron-sulfur cluster repair protein YtfE (RIC family)
LFRKKNAPNADATTNEELAQEDVAQEKSSHLNNDTVIQEEQTFFQNIMEKQELLKDIEQLLSEKAAAKDFSDEAIASITKVFHEAIREKSEDYVKQVKQVEAEKAEAQTQKEELAGELSALKEQLESTEKKLNGLEEEKVERESQARFNSRMSAIEEVYDLDEEDLKVVASEVVTLDETEESFSQYQEKLAVVFKSKSKEYLQQLADEMEAKITAEVEKRLSQKSEASTETSVEQASDVAEQSLENAEAEEAVLPNNNGESIETEETLRDRFAKAFRDNVKVTY